MYLIPTGNAATQLVLRTHPVGVVVFILFRPETHCVLVLRTHPVGVVVFILFRPETHCVLVLRTHPVGSVVFSPSMIAGLRANDEPLAHARLGSDCQQASRV